MSVPKYLFRYRSDQSEHFWDDLTNAIEFRRFFLGSALSQNDPFEASPVVEEPDIDAVEIALKMRFGKNPIFSKEIIENQIGRKISRQEFRRTYRDARPSRETAQQYCDVVRETITNIQNRVRLASFSEVSDSALMWGLYANGHRGAALCFELSLEDYAEGGLLPMQVTYQDNRPSISVAEFASADFENSGIGEKIAMSTYCTKSSEWAYEREWRIFDADGDQPPSYAEVRSIKPIGLIFGCKTDEVVIDEAVGRFGASTKLYQCELSERDFEVRHRELILGR